MGRSTCTPSTTFLSFHIPAAAFEGVGGSLKEKCREERTDEAKVVVVTFLNRVGFFPGKFLHISGRLIKGRKESLRVKLERCPAVAMSSSYVSLDTEEDGPPALESIAEPHPEKDTAENSGSPMKGRAFHNFAESELIEIVKGACDAYEDKDTGQPLPASSNNSGTREIVVGNNLFQFVLKTVMKVGQLVWDRELADVHKKIESLHVKESMESSRNDISYAVPVDQNKEEIRGEQNGEEGQSDEEEDEDEIECDEVDSVGKELQCLLCQKVEDKIETAFAHMKTAHGLDLTKLRNHYKMDQLSYLKMINWLRSLKDGIVTQEVPNLPLMDHIVGLREVITIDAHTPACPPWMNEKWLQPSDPEDEFLQYDFESLFEDEQVIDSQKALTVNRALSNAFPQTSKDKDVVIGYLQDTLTEMTKEKDIMKSFVGRLVSGDSPAPPGFPRKTKEADAAEGEDSYYFESYEEIGIHSQMINDLPRTGAYKRCICDNPHDFKGKTVMDLGCGTGILSMFCVDAGAKVVHAVECSNIIYDAIGNVFTNDMGDKILCHKGRLETMSLDIEKVDILVSEFMGYFLIYEGMLSSYLYARDHFLKPNGMMLPSSAKMFIVAISDDGKYRSEIDAWNSVFGYKMEAMRGRALKEPAVQLIDVETVVSDHVVVKSLNLHTCSSNDTVINDSFFLNISKDCKLTGIGGYFSVGFGDGSQHKETLSTSPEHPSTHWKQIVFYLPKKLNVVKGECVAVKMQCKPHHHNPRWLAVDLTVKDIHSSYEMR